MEVKIANIKEFMDEFEYEIFPVIKGVDGQGIEKFKKIVEQKRIAVAMRKIRKLENEIFSEVTRATSKEIVSNYKIEEKYIGFAYSRENHKYTIEFEKAMFLNISGESRDFNYSSNYIVSVDEGNNIINAC